MPDQLVRLRAALADRYRVDSEIGRGGMSTVYLAEDLKHHRPVALKVLRPELAVALGPDRFLREIELSARLTHPHILPLHDSGNAAGLLYYVMPYVEGESLRDRLGREKQLPVEDALQISREVADALSYAHSHGVIHRDIKPENILLQAGHAVVADFGIARAIDAAGGANLTETGVSLGTPAYMSPEQAASSKDLDGRSDLYSLGCVLYEMLAGQPPFTGPTVESMIHQHLAAEPPHIMGIRPAVPAHVAATLERALAKTPADRFNPVALFAEALVPRGPTAPIPYPAEAGRSTRRWAWQSVALVGIAALVLLGGVVLAARWLRPVPPAPRHPRTAIAVLPFQNLSAEGPHDYFSAGLHDELLTQLAKVSALKVIGRTTVLTYEGSSKRLSDIGRELAVGSIVEGSVQVVEDRLRVNVQLVDPVSEAHLWAERYDGTLDDAFAVQSDIARQIVAAVGARLRATEQSAIAQAPTTNAQAYRLYLQGRFFWNRRSEVGLLEAIRLFQQATELDPTFARAYAGLADCYSLLVDRGLDRPRVGFERAKAEALRAIAIDSSIAEAYTSLGFVNHRYDWDAQAAIQNFEKAIALNPSYATAYQWLANVYRDLGRTAESLALFDKAMAVDPLSLIINRGFGRALFVAGKYQEAITQLQSTLRLDSTFDPARETLARIYGHLGMHSRAIEQLLRVREATGDSPRTLWLLAHAYASAGRADTARRILAGLLARADEQYIGPAGIAMVYLALQDLDQAFAWFESAVSERDPDLLELSVWPPSDAVRADPRYGTLRQRIGFWN